MRPTRKSLIAITSLGCAVALLTDPSAALARKANPPGKKRPIANTAPTISGTPATSVTQGTVYRFVASARDADGNPLVFGITGRPPWASFDSTTGTLQGTPGAADVRTYSDIVISVTDGRATARLPAFSIAVQAYSFGSATVTWLPPTRNVDGSALTNLTGYRVYWGEQPSSYTRSAAIMNPGITAYVIENLVSGTHYFSVTAVNSNGVESAPSAEVSKLIP
jgi:putative Ig domain-containing protein